MVPWHRQAIFPSGARQGELSEIDDGYWQGAPIGGFGSGSIGHTYRGDFARWHLDVGAHYYQTVWADQFSLYQETAAGKKAFVLFPGKPPSGTLSAWNWGDPAVKGTYYAVYPRVWYAYDTAPVRVTIEQFSPVIPHNYKETSYPVGVFLCQLENTGAEPVTASIMLTWENLIGGALLGGDAWRMKDDYNHYQEAKTSAGKVQGGSTHRPGDG